MVFTKEAFDRPDEFDCLRSILFQIRPGENNILLPGRRAYSPPYTIPLADAINAPKACIGYLQSVRS